MSRTIRNYPHSLQYFLDNGSTKIQHLQDVSQMRRGAWEKSKAKREARSSRRSGKRLAQSETYPE